MQLLLDTHTFLWFIGNHPDLSATALQLITDPNNSLYVSIVTPWELAIKTSVGKLRLRQTLSDLFPKHLIDNDIMELPINILPCHCRVCASVSSP